MKGRVNGLKKLIMEESPSAYYVHCFAHQLQLTLVYVAKENIDCSWFFGQLAYLLNVLGMSCKKISMLRVAQAEYMIEALSLGEIETGQGLNQEMGLARLGDTRWGSHYRTVMHVIALYPSIKKVLLDVWHHSIHPRTLMDSILRNWLSLLGFILKILSLKRRYNSLFN